MIKRAAKSFAICGVYLTSFLFASTSFSASLREAVGEKTAYDSAVNQNFRAVNNELSNAVHKSSTETITGVKHFTGYTDFVTFGATTGTISNVVASTVSTTRLDAPISEYRRPGTTFISVTTIDLENNTGTANESCVLFRDGDYRCVTENTGSTSQYRRAIITETAALSGTHNSGMRSGETETVNTTYAVYYVKTTDNASKFVIVLTTATPTQANYSNLNTYFNTDGWVFSGYVKNGDNSGATGDLLDYMQQGNVTLLRNVATGNSALMHGIRLATSGSASSVTWTYSTGTGATDLPPTAKQAWFSYASNGSAGERRLRNSGASYDIAAANSEMFAGMVLLAPSSDNLLMSGPASSAIDIFLSGWIDGALSDGAGPF